LLQLTHNIEKGAAQEYPCMPVGSAIEGAWMYSSDAMRGG
jgi:hypothetical protein